MDQKEQTAVLDPDQLEKSWDESISALRNILGGEDKPVEPAPAADLEKAKKAPPDDEEEGDEEEDETDEEEEEEKMPFPKAKKSLPDAVAEQNEESEAAMDVAPFLKSLAEGIQVYLDASLDNLYKSLSKKLGAVSDLSKALAKAVVNSAEMQKSIRDVVYKIGKTQIPTGTVLRKAVERFEPQSATDPQNYDKAATLQKSYELLKSGKIDILMATKIEGRVAKNLPLPNEVAALFAEGGKQ
jgi:hypothetical protein